MNLFNQPSPGPSLSLKPLRLSKPTFLLLVAPSSWGYSKAYHCPKGENCGHHVGAGWLSTGPSDSSWDTLYLIPLQGNTGRWAFLPAITVLGLGCRPWVEVLLYLLKTTLCATVLWNWRMQALLVLRARHLELGVREAFFEQQLQKLGCQTFVQTPSKEIMVTWSYCSSQREGAGKMSTSFPVFGESYSQPVYMCCS